ncbi:nucleotidyltransferase domain-containing protein [Agrobacterium sp.]|uniref:nucleotidyltransferase domain-containing protein n=1 Tax=Agrobacterium sp. TaxID=361 RepID=UPI0028A709BF|nr:nucleotidyltransferase domain-containing protein [Agrobacterium sp.]
MHSKQTRIDAALSTAQKCFATRFNGASHMFVAGSIMRGEGTVFSDIDLVVIFPRLPQAWRESFLLDGFPIEAFVHDPETLTYFIGKDVESGTPVMVDMIASGTIIGNTTDATAMQRQARDLLADGPKPLATAQLDAMRYVLSDLADDLRAEGPADEMAAIAAQLYPRLIDFILLGQQQWTGKGKWAARLLRRFDAQLAAVAAEAFKDAVHGNRAKLVALTDQQLARHGGRLFDRYHAKAPRDARISPDRDLLQ